MNMPTTATYLEDTMREWISFGIGGAIGVAIGVVIGETFGVSHVVGKIIALSSAMLGGGLTTALAIRIGWIKEGDAA
jgi:hypothetical protein